MRATALFCALLLCACHESLGLVGDARMDHSAEPPVDAPVDALVDGIHDAYVDPVVDPAVDPDPDGPCPPRSHDEMVLEFSFDDDSYLEYGIVLVCWTEEFREDPYAGRVNIWFSCRTDEGTRERHNLLLQTDPYAPIDASVFYESELVVRYVSDPIFWVNRWISIQNITGGLVLAAASAETIAPEEWEGWYAPLSAWRLGGLCPPEEGWCGTLEREAIEVTDGDASLVVFDGNIHPLDTGEGDIYHVMVPAAHHYRYIECEDVPIDWVQALIVRLP